MFNYKTYKNPVTLTDHQNEKLTEAKRILTTSNVLVIKGKAGVGKTTLVRFLLPFLIDKDSIADRIYITAPTNKAVSVLQNMGINSTQIAYKTIHSALKLKRRIQKDGTVVYKNDNVPDYLKEVGAIIIDECSMISSNLLDNIKRAQRYYPHIKIVYLGDPGQINPVNEVDTPVFNQQYPTIELTEIIRQAEGNPIIQLSRNIDDIRKKIPNRDGNIGYIYTNSIADVVSTLAYVNGSDKLKYLAWTNENINKINSMVRRKIYGEPRKVEIGETLIFNAPYGDDYINGQVIKVKDDLCIEEKPFFIYTSKIGKDIRPIEINLKYYLFNNCSIRLIHEDSERTFKNVCTELVRLVNKNEFEWLDYFNFREKFADLKYAHAMTVHKSQGSTYKQVIINYRDIMSNQSKEERERLLYTAITRASELVIFFNI